MKTTALIVAAGAGVRMGSPSPKAFMLLEGRPLVAWSLDLFQRHGAVDDMVLVAPPGRLAGAPDLRREFPKLVAVTEGGARRQDSVARGLTRILESGEDDLVLVHDAARPLADPELVDRVIEAAARTGAAVPGIEPPDTVRSLRETPAGSPRLSAGTLDRSRLVLVQTPQGFSVGLLREAHARATGDVTDDAALVEALGRAVEVVEGSPANFKITRPGDLTVAAGLLRRMSSRTPGADRC